MAYVSTKQYTGLYTPLTSQDSRMMAVDIDLGSKFRAGVPKPLFQISGYNQGGGSGVGRYSVTRDGKRLLFSVTNELADSPITVVLNWTAKLRSRF